MAVTDTNFVQSLIEKYGYPLVGALVRLVRVMVFIGVTAGLTYGVDHLSDFNVPSNLQAFVLAALLAADKWWREHQKEVEGA